MYVCMYLSIYVAIRRPRAYHACAHAQIYLDGIPVKIVIMLTKVPLIVVRVIVSVITCSSSGVVGVNALLSAHACKKRREGTVPVLSNT